MKKYFLLVSILITTLTSCSLDSEDTQNFILEIMPIESAVMPEEFTQGETYDIAISYYRPSECYEFNDFLYEIQGQERTIAVINTVYPNLACSGDSELVTVHFDFTVTGTETYLFQFYQGRDEQGFDQYLLVEVPVVED